MEKKQKSKYEYSAISVKADVAVRFRNYSKQFSKSNSEVLHRMIHFLSWNGLDPFKHSIDRLMKEQEKTLKQIEYVIAIIKNQEKMYHRPTYEMVKILFEAYCKENKEVKKERIFIPQPIIEEAKDNYLKIRHERLEQELEGYIKDCRQLLEKIEPVEPTFGKPYLKVNLSVGDYEKLKIQLEKE